VLGQLVQMHIAGISFIPQASDADLRFIHVFFGQARAVEHGLRRALTLGLCNSATILVQFHGHLSDLS
jgi:hypothetical protein